MQRVHLFRSHLVGFTDVAQREERIGVVRPRRGTSERLGRQHSWFCAWGCYECCVAHQLPSLAFALPYFFSCRLTVMPSLSVFNTRLGARTISWPDLTPLVTSMSASPVMPVVTS